METAETLAAVDAVHQRLLAALDPADRPVAELQRAGVKKTAAYAAALGLADVPPPSNAWPSNGRKTE